MKILSLILLISMRLMAGEVTIEDSKGCVKQPKNTPTPDPLICEKEFYCCRKDKMLYPRVDKRPMSCAGDFGNEQLLSSQFSVPCAKYPATYDPYNDCPESVLTVSVEGPGKVASNSSGINCGDDCTEEYPSGVDVELTASPEPGAEFVSWSGACAGTTEVCRVKMDKNHGVHAVFKTNVLTVTLAGDGQGSVSGTGISCREDCEEHYRTGTSVSLSATAISTEDFDSVFVNWSGDCSGTGSCVVAMNGDKAVTANFKRIYHYKLNVVKSGVGTGTVTGFDINCGGTCEKIYDEGTKVVLTAKADTGSTFKGWSGPCTGTSTCSVTMDTAKTVVADFDKPSSKILTVILSGTGKGSVTGTKINCSPDCRESYLPAPAPNESVRLTAKPDSTSTFTRWTGACTGAFPTCTVLMDASKNVTAIFNSAQLTIAKSGNGSGVVTSNPSGISCGSTCVKNFKPQSSVTLTAKADLGSIFKSWTSPCPATDSCTITMAASGNRVITATFIKASELVVSKLGAGTGTVTSPAGINCGSECKKEILAGTKVSLTATPDANSYFKEWQGKCTGTNTTCHNLVINGVTTVNAVFESNILTVTKTGNGTVTDTGGMINCPGTCTGKYGRGVNVTLSATPAAGSTFIGWSGACSGLAACVVTMTASKTVNAEFSDSGLVVSKEGTGNGTVVSSPPGISCGSKCAAAFSKNSSVSLTATADRLSKFEGWGLDCASARKADCALTMNAPKKASANFSEICDHDGRCEGGRAENCMNCYNDCGCKGLTTCVPSGASYICIASCGNHSCDNDIGENCRNCQKDCGDCETTSSTVQTTTAATSVRTTAATTSVRTTAATTSVRTTAATTSVGTTAATTVQTTTPMTSVRVTTGMTTAFPTSRSKYFTTIR